MKCVHCGAPLDPASQFCSKCGRPANGQALPMREGDEQQVTAVRVDDVLLGRYRLLQKIGEGGMGSVYLAHDKELDREVAVKLLASSLVNDAEVVERFEREARMTARLDHPNIVPVYDVGRHQGRPFIVMKKLEGETLAALLRSKGGLTADETLKLMRQFAAGLDHIHQRGFIHRDIKAGNLFVGPAGLATILDFGILRSSSASDGLTKTGVVMGTPHYMAPEQAMGSRDVDHRVDLYALAVVLFECLTGTLPFEADSELRLIQMQAHTPPPDLIERAPWIARPIADVVRRALAKRPDDRFASASELVKALEQACQQVSPGAVTAPEAGAAAAPSAPTYQGPKDSPGTAPSWRRRADEPVPASGLPVPAALEPGTSPRLKPAAMPFEVKAVEVAPASPGPAVPAARRAFGLLLAVVAVAAAALLVWRPWTAREGPPDQTLQATALDASVDDAGESAVVLAAAVDAGGPEVAVVSGADDAGAAGLAAVELDAGRGLKAPRVGRLSVLSSHQGEPFWAQVYIDGVEKGRTPLQLDLNPGRYQLRIERTGFRSQLREIKVASGKSSVVQIDLAP